MPTAPTVQASSPAGAAAARGGDTSRTLPSDPPIPSSSHTGLTFPIEETFVFDLPDVLDVVGRHTCRPSVGQRLAWLAGGVALGTVAAYLGDPDRGRDRRAGLQERGTQVASQVASQVTAVTGASTDPALSGAADELTPDLKDPSDAVLIERVRADAIGPSEVRNSGVVTTAEGGVVTVRGQVDERGQREDLLRRIREVEGVEDIVDLTHLPDEPAPTRS